MPRLLGLGFCEQLPVASNQLLPAKGQPVAEFDFATTLWQERGLDMLVQVGLILAGVMGVLGLLAEQTFCPTLRHGSLYFLRPMCAKLPL